MLELQAIHKRLPDPSGGHWVLAAGLDLQVAPGETVAVLGPSGSGKSTLLKMFAGLEAPSSGRIVLHDGHDAAGRASGHRSMAMVFQEATLMPWARVADNVRLPLDLAGMPRGESEPRIADALDMVGLSQFRQSYPRELSGGMQMRVSVARALITEPQLLLMDEPFAALDEITRQKLNVDLLAARDAQGFATLFVTHSVYEAVFLSQRVLVMAARPGRVVAELAIDAPYPRPPGFRHSAAFTDAVRSRPLRSVSSRRLLASSFSFASAVSSISRRRTLRVSSSSSCGIESISVGVPEGAKLEVLPPDTRKPVLFYGTSILQGGCASRPGMVYTSIIGRRLDETAIATAFKLACR